MKRVVSLLLALVMAFAGMTVPANASAAGGRAESAAYAVEVTDLTKGAATTSLANGSYNGEVSFSVTCATACVVALETADGYEELACVMEDDVPVFTIDVTADTRVVIVLRGDTNLDGSVGTKDATFVRKIVAQVAGIENQLPNLALSKLAGDSNADGSVGTKDATAIRKFVAQVAGFTLPWKIDPNPTPRTHTLTFDPNGGSVEETSRVLAKGDPYGELPEPQRDGYSFEGWFTEAEGGEPVTAATVMGSSDVTVYAHWTQLAQEEVILPELGEYFTFGYFGREDIEWLVLDTEGTRVLAISRYGLIAKPFNEEGERCTWEGCTLRQWLNQIFLREAFSAEEQALIQSTTVETPGSEAWENSAENTTEDQIFVLSSQEAERYFANKEARKCFPTAYAKELEPGVDQYYVEGSDGCCTWWLRTPAGTDGNFKICVDREGKIEEGGNYVGLSEAAVRPAMWIDYAAVLPETAHFITFDLNSAPGKTMQRVVAEGTVYRELPVPEHPFCDFAGWFTAAEGGEQVFATTVMGTHDVTLYAHWTIRETPRIGGYFTLGHYGEEDIEWQILDISGTKAMVISRYSLESKRFDNGYNSDITWKDCSLREWLNGPFPEKAFDAQAQALILTSAVKLEYGVNYLVTERNTCYDRLFCLSREEVEHFFPTAEEKKCAAACKTYGFVDYEYTDDGRAIVEWWLRSKNTYWAELVDARGEIFAFGDLRQSYRVRPAMWIDLEKLLPDHIHTLNFDPNGGAVEESSRNFVEGAVAGALPLPVRPGLTFDGWYTEAEGGSPVFADTPMGDSDASVYAHWKIPERGDITSIGCHGEEPIRWQVLDRQGSLALVISCDVIDAKPYDAERNGCTWETCSIRQWLNGTFRESALTPEEQGGILSTRNQVLIGEYAEDALFLLNREEAQTYFDSDEERKAVPTGYARVQGGWDYDRTNVSYDPAAGFETCRWWLRLEGEYLIDAYYVDADGSVSSQTYPMSEALGIRPTMWIDLAYWSPDAFGLLSFDPNGGEVEESGRRLQEGQTYGELPVPTRFGYDFAGWFTAPEGGDPVDASMTMGAEAVTVYAHWTAQSMPRIGEYITVGEYGEEAVEWLVLSADGAKALVISRYGLDAQPYHTEDANVTWEECTLRAWLNGEFYDRAFTASQKDHICLVTIPNPDHPTYGTAGGNDTTDSLFLLSVQEAETYFESDGARTCTATAYARSHGVYTTGYYSSVCGWLLRSPGESNTYAAIVNLKGSLSYTYVTNTEYAVRPVMWIDYTDILPVHTLTFDPNGGSVEEASREVAEGTLYGKLPVPVRKGYLFDGWFTAAEGGEPVDASTAMGQEDITVYAHWTEVLLPGVGEYLTLGQYGGEAIEWLVLSVDGTKVLVISRYGLDAKPYHSKSGSIAWNDCSLRQWLNENFLNEAFSAEEAANILLTALPNMDVPAEDKLFLLDPGEAEWYFDSNIARTCRPTDYARSHGVTIQNSGCSWLLRGNENSSVYYVNGDGRVQSSGSVTNNKYAVRPAMWIDYQDRISDAYHVVTFDANEGSASETSRLVREGASYGKLPLAARFGFRFDGWFTAAEGGEPVFEDSAAGSGDLTLYAHWTPEAPAAMPEAGDHISFGLYGGELIEWLVLEVDGTKALLISSRGLDSQPYHSVNEEVDWENCTLRSWLNETFINLAFNEGERNRIRTATVGNPNGETEDTIFVLSQEEAERYFASKEARMCVPTAYAKWNGAIFSDSYLIDGEGTCTWWLRTPGYSSDLYAKCVIFGGGVYTTGYRVNRSGLAVRPVMWIDLEP